MTSSLPPLHRPPAGEEMAGSKQTSRPQKGTQMARQSRTADQWDVFSRASRSSQNPKTIRRAKRQANRQDRAASRRQTRDLY